MNLEKQQIVMHRATLSHRRIIWFYLYAKRAMYNLNVKLKSQNKGLKTSP